MKKVQEHPGYYTVAELAKMLYVSESALKRRIYRGEYPGTKRYKGYWLIPKSAVK